MRVAEDFPYIFFPGSFSDNIYHMKMIQESIIKRRINTLRPLSHFT